MAAGRRPITQKDLYEIVRVKNGREGGLALSRAAKTHDNKNADELSAKYVEELRKKAHIVQR